MTIAFKEAAQAALIEKMKTWDEKLLSDYEKQYRVDKAAIQQ